MGQYYKFIILSETNEIILVLNPHDFYEGAKLMENAWLNSLIANTIEFLLSPYYLQYYKSRCVMAGDYADNEYGTDENLYTMTRNCPSFQQAYKNVNVNFIVNHTQKLYVDKTKLKNKIHPLLLLIAEGNGKGSGDYRGPDSNDLVGSWSRDVISMELNKPDCYQELVCDFDDD